jgi:phosphoketolase
MPEVLFCKEVPAKKELDSIDAYWRTANYISIGQIYLLDNPLLKRPLKIEEHPVPELHKPLHNQIVYPHDPL